MNYGGIDVGKDSLDVVIRKKGKSHKCMTFNNTTAGHLAIIKYLHQHNVSHIGIEATGYYHLDLALELDDAADVDVMIINPRASKNFAKAMMQRMKTDAIDAELLAQFVERMDFIKWKAPASHVFAIRACGRRLVSLNKEKAKSKNQLHAYSRTKRTPQFVIDDVHLSIEQLENQIENLVLHALQLINESDQLKKRYERLISIKGVANRTAIKLLGELGVLAEDMLAKQWVAHAGLFPRVFESGSSVKKRATIGKIGNRYIREALYMGALSATRHDVNIRAFYLHMIEDNGLSKLQAICAVMRKMLLAMHGMLKEDKPFNGQRFYGLDNSNAH
jgi:transposase